MWGCKALHDHGMKWFCQCSHFFHLPPPSLPSHSRHTLSSERIENNISRKKMEKFYHPVTILSKHERERENLNLWKFEAAKYSLLVNFISIFFTLSHSRLVAHSLSLSLSRKATTNKIYSRNELRVMNILKNYIQQHVCSMAVRQWNFACVYDEWVGRWREEGRRHEHQADTLWIYGRNFPCCYFCCVCTMLWNTSNRKAAEIYIKFSFSFSKHFSLIFHQLATTTTHTHTKPKKERN